jgi:hypothetical protein
MGLSKVPTWEPPKKQITTIGVDQAKHVFQIHDSDAMATAL